MRTSAAESCSGDQRPDWRAVAERLEEAETPRAIVTWTLGEAALRHYLPGNSFQVFSQERRNWLVHEVVFVTNGEVAPVPARRLGPGFREVADEEIGGRLHIRRYAQRGPDLERLSIRIARAADTGFHSNGVLLGGVGPG